MQTNLCVRGWFLNLSSYQRLEFAPGLVLETAKVLGHETRDDSAPWTIKLAVGPLSRHTEISYFDCFQSWMDSQRAEQVQEIRGEELCTPSPELFRA